jgi:glycosyltransferase involved in cell wall biosynthesis
MITVLLGTYNGARFLSEQLDSLLAQTIPPDRIIVSDDNSTDTTWDILEQYANAHSSITTRHHQSVKPLSPHDGTVNTPPLPAAARNFLDLMVAERDDYLLLCDQDDKWHPNKIAVTLAKLREMEARYGLATPCLTHTDLNVVDSTLRQLNPSFRQAMNADWSRTTLRDQVVQNTATGCTIMYNRALANLLTEVPRYTVMHDWWLPLVACAFGHMEPLFDSTIDYRQHDENVIGAKNIRSLSYQISRALDLTAVRHAVRITYPQAGELLRIYGAQLSATDVALLANYTRIPSSDKLTRIATVVREGFWKAGLARNIAYLLVL